MPEVDNILADEDLYRFARQLILTGFDESHQIILKNSHAIVVGAGGLGAPVLLYLAAAGVGRITIFDDDVVELTNLNRQIIHPTANIGVSKAGSAAQAIRSLNPSINVHIREELFTGDHADLQNVSIICDASDNAKTRYAANSFAHQNKIPLIFGGAVRMEGQLAVFRSGLDDQAPCYQCLFPHMPGPELAPGCAEAGILGPITGIIGSMMALEAIRQCLIGYAATNPLGEGIGQNLILFDGRLMTMDKIEVMKNSDCPCCNA